MMEISRISIPKFWASTNGKTNLEDSSIIVVMIMVCITICNIVVKHAFTVVADLMVCVSVL
jgi:hypothetical protein